MPKPRTKSRRRTEKQILEALERKDERDTAEFFSRQVAQARGYRLALAHAASNAGRALPRVAHALEELSELVATFEPADIQRGETVFDMAELLRKDADHLRSVGDRTRTLGDVLRRLDRLYAFSDQNEERTAARQREFLQTLQRFFRRAADATHVQLVASE